MRFTRPGLILLDFPMVLILGAVVSNSLVISALHEDLDDLD